MANIVTTIYRKWSHTTPNYLTLARLITGLWGLNICYWVRFEPFSMAVLCLISGACDKLDGWWARKFRAESTAGKLLDPLADKLLSWNAVIVLGHYSAAQGDAVLLYVAFLCVFPLALTALYDYAVIKMRESDDGMRTSDLARKKQAFLFSSFGMFIIMIPLREYGHAVWSGAFLFGGLALQLATIPLLAKSARNYFAHAHDERSKRWEQKPFVRFLLRTF